MIDRPDNINVFILYAAEDEELKGELESHLSMLQRHGYIDVWHEGQILPGENKDQVISQYLKKSHLILLLISANFLAPDCYGQYENELRIAYERQKQGEVKIVPVILRHCMWQMDLLESLNPLPKGGHPVRSTHWENADLAFQNIAFGLKQITSDLLQLNKSVAEAQIETEPSESIQDIEPQTSHVSESIKSSQRDLVAERLINDLFSLFKTLDEDTCSKMAISIVHSSLVQFQELEQKFLKYKFLKAYHNSNLYTTPVKIENIKITGRNSIGRLAEKEAGEEVMYEIAKKKNIGALPGHVRIFFPADGGLPKISNLSL